MEDVERPFEEVRYGARTVADHLVAEGYIGAIFGGNPEVSHITFMGNMFDLMEDDPVYGDQDVDRRPGLDDRLNAVGELVRRGAIIQSGELVRTRDGNIDTRMYRLPKFSDE